MDVYSRSVWTMDLERALIGAVEIRPELWKKNCGSIRDMVQAWDAVSKITGVPAAVCKSRFRNIRNTYMGYVKEVKAGLRTTPYKYAAEMMFLTNDEDLAIKLQLSDLASVKDKRNWIKRTGISARKGALSPEDDQDGSPSMLATIRLTVQDYFNRCANSPNYLQCKICDGLVDRGRTIYFGNINQVKHLKSCHPDLWDEFQATSNGNKDRNGSSSSVSSPGVATGISGLNDASSTAQLLTGPSNVNMGFTVVKEEIDQKTRISKVNDDSSTAQAFTGPSIINSGFTVVEEEIDQDEDDFGLDHGIGNVAALFDSDDSNEDDTDPNDTQYQALKKRKLEMEIELYKLKTEHAKLKIMKLQLELKVKRGTSASGSRT